jgi:signal recognition particle GTPase
VRRVIAGRLDGAPARDLLVVDATTGQNGLSRRGCSPRPRASPGGA